MTLTDDDKRLIAEWAGWRPSITGNDIFVRKDVKREHLTSCDFLGAATMFKLNGPLFGPALAYVLRKTNWTPSYNNDRPYCVSFYTGHLKVFWEFHADTLEESTFLALAAALRAQKE